MVYMDRPLVCLCNPDGEPLGVVTDPCAAYTMRVETVDPGAVGAEIAPRDFFQGWGKAHWSQDATILSNYREFRDFCIELGCPPDSLLPFDMTG